MFIKFEIANDGFMSLKKIYGKKVSTEDFFYYIFFRNSRV